MGRKKAAFYFSLLAGAVILGLSVFGFVNLLGRPAIPWDALAQTTGIPSELLPRAVVRADGFEVGDQEFDFKFVAARHRVGDPVEFVFVKDGREEAVRERLVPYYANRTFPIVYLLTGVFGFIIGFAVFILRSEDARARIFFWLCLAFSSAVMISGEWYGVQGRALYLVPGVLFFFAYTLTPALLLRFALTLTPRSKVRGFLAIWGASLLFGGFFSAAFASSLLLPSVEIFRINKYFVLFRLYSLALCVAAVVILIRSYRASASRERRDQIKWVLLGLAMGLGPFMLLYQLPRSLDLSPPLGEEAASAFFVLLPLALAFTILKYKLMDVDLIINRSVVYSLLTMTTVGVYLLSIEGLKQLFTRSSPSGRGWVPVGAAVIAAVAFAPARNRIQVLVDKAFFRRGYDYRRAVRDFNTASAKACGAGDLLDLFKNTLVDILPVGKVGWLVLEPGDGPPGIVLRRGLDDAAVSLLARRPESGAPWTDVRPDVPGYEVTLPLPLGEGAPAGWVFVGRKKSGLKFTDEDRELLETLAGETAAALRRIRLQEEVVYERASREKSEELGRMKTEFISSVSHELRTPMTSLQGISQLLQSGKVGDEAHRERLLELMAGECGRLGRFLHNVLDFGRIEQDAKRYEFRETDLKPLVAEVTEIARSATAGEDLDVEVETPEGPVWIEADPDSVRQALLNLVDNAIKYSAGRKRVAVRLAENDGNVEVSVSDQGIGIPAEDREKIFEAFFRSPAAVRHDPKGVGLGLKIVKHIMDAHGGDDRPSEQAGEGDDVHTQIPEKAETMKKILIIDDDRVLRQTLAAVLETEGYGVGEAGDGREGLNKALQGNYDLVVLDIVMPTLGGLEICRKLREAGRQVPVIIMSGRKKKEVDKVLGLELGGDDYLTKPFGTDEFTARVHAVLRRSRPEVPEIEDCSFGDVAVDFRKKIATKGGRDLHLTAREFSLLKLLAACEGQVVSRETILSKVWEYEKFPTTRTIDTFMYNLRRKVEDAPAAPKHLVTVPWSGYKFQK